MLQYYEAEAPSPSEYSCNSISKTPCSKHVRPLTQQNSATWSEAVELSGPRFLLAQKSCYSELVLKCTLFWKDQRMCTPLEASTTAFT